MNLINKNNELKNECSDFSINSNRDQIKYDKFEVNFSI